MEANTRRRVAALLIGGLLTSALAACGTNNTGSSTGSTAPPDATTSSVPTDPSAPPAQQNPRLPEPPPPLCSDPVPGTVGNIPTLEKEVDEQLDRYLRLTSDVSVNRNIGGLWGHTHVLNTYVVKGYHATVMAVLKNGCGDVIYVTPPQMVGVGANNLFERNDRQAEWSDGGGVDVTRFAVAVEIYQSPGGNDATQNFNNWRDRACLVWEGLGQGNCPVPRLPSDRAKEAGF